MGLRSLILAICFLFGTMGMTQVFSAEARMAYVDLARLFDQYEKTKTYDKLLEADNLKFQDLRNKKIEGVKDLQGKSAILKDEEKKKVDAEIEKQKAEILEFDRAQRTDLTKARDEKVRDILLEIEKTVSEYAKKEGISYVFNDRVLIYGIESSDITDLILKKLNDVYQSAKK